MAMALGFNCFLIIVLSWLYGVSYTFIGTTISTDYCGAGGFPRLVIALTLLLLIYDSVMTFKKLKSTEKSSEPIFEKQGIKQFLTGVILLGLYVLVVELLGYIVATALFTFLLIKSMNYQNNLKATVFTVAFVAALVIVFGNIFDTQLPRGVGFLKEISFYLY
jgi:hypothetical protein